MSKDTEETSGGSASFSIPAEVAELVRDHLERHGRLLGRPPHRIGPFLAEAARALVQQDLMRVERHLRISRLQDEDPHEDPDWQDPQA